VSNDRPFTPRRRNVIVGGVTSTDARHDVEPASKLHWINNLLEDIKTIVGTVVDLSLQLPKEILAVEQLRRSR